MDVQTVQNFMQILYSIWKAKSTPKFISMYLKDNMQNQTISELYTDNKKQNILATLMIFLN